MLGSRVRSPGGSLRQASELVLEPFFLCISDTPHHPPGRTHYQISIPSGKRYPIPAQNIATEDCGRVWPLIPAQAATFFLPAQKRYPIPAQDIATEDSGRIWPQIPAQAATFSLPAQKRYPIPAQNVATEHFGRIWPLIPSQAATFFLPAQKRYHIPAQKRHRWLWVSITAFHCPQWVWL